MDFDRSPEFVDQNTQISSPPSDGSGDALRAKTSLRLKYEAEALVIERRLGSLETIRGKLGLTQRKMTQLLLVDPSAWTRWTKGESKAPPHIYRMLQWYLAVEEKYPALDLNFWLNSVAQVPDEKAKMETALVEQDRRISELRKQVQVLAAQLEAQPKPSRLNLSVAALCAVSGLAVGALLIFAWISV